MNPLELAITACIHLIINDPDTMMPKSLGSGVFIRYKDRYFICTAEHVARNKNLPVSIITGVVKNGETLLYEYGTFSFLQKIELKKLDSKGLVEQLNDLESDGFLDIAFRETILLENIIQPARKLIIDDIELDIKEGGKSIIIADHGFKIDKNELFCFFGRTNPSIGYGVLDFKERLYSGLTLHEIQDDYIAFDLGCPIGNHDRFKGCSGAPIFDTQGRLIALLTHGDKDVNSSIVYGFRFDRTKFYIDLMYFNEVLENLAN